MRETQTVAPRVAESRCLSSDVLPTSPPASAATGRPTEIAGRPAAALLGVITRGRMRIWVRGPVPTWVDAEHLMALWDEGNAKARLPGQREGDKHVRPFEEMMLGFRQLGFRGAGDDGRTPPDWIVSLAGDEFDADVLRRMEVAGEIVDVPHLFTTGRAS